MGKRLPETCWADSKMNKIAIVASSWLFIVLFTYIDDARSNTNQIVGAFAKLRRATTCFTTFACLAVCMEQIEIHCTEFHETRHLTNFWKPVENIQSSLHSDRHYGHFTLWALYIMGILQYGHFKLWAFYIMGILHYGHFTLWSLYVIGTLYYDHSTLWAFYIMGTLHYGHFTLWAFYIMGILHYGHFTSCWIPFRQNLYRKSNTYFVSNNFPSENRLVMR